MVTPQETVRVRYPPSPTGLFNLGGVRTALSNWLFAKKEGGKFILRIEDTDIQRSKKEYEENILESLQWLGLSWDEGPDTTGPFGPYRSSDRLDIYENHLKTLLSQKKAYFCFCSKEELEAEKQTMLAQGLAPKYNGHCASLSEEETEARRKEGESPVIRFRIPQVEVEFHDIIRGKIKFDASLIGDIVIARDLRSPLYSFSVVVDDAAMNISHVIRGEDLLSTTRSEEHTSELQSPILISRMPSSA